ncbi:MAG: hypothetical protein ACK43K_14865, partial [Chitinophagales bacterium]
YRFFVYLSKYSLDKPQLRQAAPLYKILCKSFIKFGLMGGVKNVLIGLMQLAQTFASPREKEILSEG